MFSEWATNGILQNYCQAKHLRRLENFFLGRQKESSPQIGRTSRGPSCASPRRRAPAGLGVRRSILGLPCGKRPDNLLCDIEELLTRPVGRPVAPPALRPAMGKYR